MALQYTNDPFENPPNNGPVAVRYPSTLGSPPFEKWILFEVKSARHIIRSGMVSASNTVDATIKSVALYLPTDALSSSLTVDWQDDSYGAAAGAAIEAALQSGKDPTTGVTALGGGSTTDQIKKLGGMVGSAIAAGAVTAGKQMALELTTDLLNAPAGIINALRGAVGLNSSGDVGELSTEKVAALGGYATNPRVDLFFKSVQYRKHSFTFTMVPRSKQEADNIDQILNIFQYYMLPSFGSDTEGGENSLFIGYPYEFEISTFTEYNGSNHHITTFDRSVLESVLINQSSNDKVSFVDDEGGYQYYPSSTTLELHFQEVRLQGRDKQKVIWRGKGPKPKNTPRDFAGNQNDPNKPQS